MKLTPERFALLERGWLVVDARLTRNALRCLVCGTVIESTYQHDYRTCGCSNWTMVDGGLAYQRWGAVDPSKVESLAEFGPPPDLVALVGKGCETCTGSELLTAETECPVIDTAGNHPIEHDGAVCWHCDGRGTRSKLVRLTGQPVTIYAWKRDEDGEMWYPTHDAILVDPSGDEPPFLFTWRDEMTESIDLGPDPASLIGCWAFPCEVVG